MSDRFVVTAASGVPVIRTSSKADAERWLTVLRGQIIDNGTVDA